MLIPGQNRPLKFVAGQTLTRRDLRSWSQKFSDLKKIMQLAPHYRHLHRVRPGLTSLGQVKYGYAETVPQMVERLKFDILYIENMSLAMDFRVLLYTLKIIVEGRGK